MRQPLKKWFGPEQREDLAFSSDTSAALLERTHRFGHLLLWGVALFVVVALVWASVATLDEVTRAEGQVIPSSQIQVVQNLEGGIVKELLIREGDVVEKGQILLRIDDTRFSSSFREGRVRVAALEAKIARLNAEVEQIDFEVPEVVTETDPQIAENERSLYARRQQELNSALAILERQVDQRRQELVESRSRREQLGRSYELLQDELRRTAPLVSEGVVSEVELLRLKRTVNDTRGDLDSVRLSLPRLNAAYKEAQSKVREYRLRFVAEAQAELNEAKNELSALSETSLAMEDRVARTLVRSPVRGTIKQLKVNTVGGVIQPGMDLVEIVPLEDTLLIEARVRPSDIAFLRPQQAAVVKLTAYDYAIYGGLDARLEQISADTIVDEKDDHYFQIRVRTVDNHLGDDDNPLPIISGMTATVDILTGKKTVLSYLMKPLLRARERAMRER
ncbi:MAG: HlyD family type I secretion periplasmic adaptor subunit [Gammaproteobacteria bacterium]|nr:HlyD family type I secretion periplasmic adaptor subunit [Gammaproteobacteria bacterium]